LLALLNAANGSPPKEDLTAVCVRLCVSVAK